MTWKTKFMIALLAISAVAFVGVREMQSACGPAAKAKVGAHAHDHGHDGSQDTAGEGFGHRVCEAGLLAAIGGMFGSKENSAPAKAAPAVSPAAPDDHATGEHKHDGEAGEHKHDGKAGHDHAGEAGHNHGASAHAEDGAEGFVKLSAAQISSGGIDMAPAMSGKLVKEISAPGRIAVNADAQAKVVPKLSGTIAKITKQLGEPVKAGDLLATIESREIADAKAEYLASWRAQELAKSVYEREDRLWRQKVTAEQDYLSAKNAAQESGIKLDLASQRLHAIGLSEAEVSAIRQLGDNGSYRFYDIRSPIGGRVTARDAVMGQTVGTATEIFTIADLSTVWVEMAVAPGDLSFAKEGQDVRIQAGTQTGTAKIIALSPVIDPETRSAKAIAALDNSSGNWRLGDYVEARLISGELDANIVVPRAATQTIKGQKVVFVNEGGGFRMRPITTGREDSVNVEVLSGLEFGETVATANTFTLKAELGKAEAEHEH